MSFRPLLALLAFAPAAGSPSAEPAVPRQRPLTEVRFETSADRIDRGRYLAEHLLQCFVCHSERDWSQPGAPPIPSRSPTRDSLRRDGSRRSNSSLEATGT